MTGSDPLLKKCVAAIREVYGSRCEGVVLYGSCARGEEDEESDIDLLVLLNDDFDLWEEIKRLTDVLFPMQLECDRYISAKPASAEEYRGGARHFYRTVQKDEVLLP